MEGLGLESGGGLPLGDRIGVMDVPVCKGFFRIGSVLAELEWNQMAS